MTTGGEQCKKRAVHGDKCALHARKVADESEVIARVGQCAKWVIAGWSPAEIQTEGCERWSVGERQVREYVARAREQIDDEARALGLATPGWHVATRMKIYAESMRVGDFSAAIRAVNDLAKLQGLYKRAHRVFALPEFDPSNRDSVLQASAELAKATAAGSIDREVANAVGAQMSQIMKASTVADAKDDDSGADIKDAAEALAEIERVNS